MKVKKSFEPIINKDSKILILGSLPSDKSIMANEYYANKTNHFWRILISIFNGTQGDIETYANKIQFILKNHIALWDTYKQANRKGSEDKNIVNGEFNDLKWLLAEYPNIEIILLNGKAAQKAFEKYIKKESLQCVYQYVPSSSSLNASYSLHEKVACWKKALTIEEK